MSAQDVQAYPHWTWPFCTTGTAPIGAAPSCVLSETYNSKAFRNDVFNLSLLSRIIDGAVHLFHLNAIELPSLLAIILPVNREGERASRHGNIKP